MYYMHRIKRIGSTVDKGIEVKENLDAAEQSFHAYLGAYAYRRDGEVDFVHCMITDETDHLWENEQWSKPEPDPESIEEL